MYPKFLCEYSDCHEDADWMVTIQKKSGETVVWHFCAEHAVVTVNSTLWTLYHELKLLVVTRAQ
jgi:hypothetical protein